MRNKYFLYIHLCDIYRYDFRGCALALSFRNSIRIIFMLLTWFYYGEAMFNFEMAAIKWQFTYIASCERVKFDISTLSMYFNSRNLNTITITINDSHVECHIYSKWPPSNNKIYIKGYHIIFKVIMLAVATNNYIWQEIPQSIFSQLILINNQQNYKCSNN